MFIKHADSYVATIIDSVLINTVLNNNNTEFSIVITYIYVRFCSENFINSKC